MNQFRCETCKYKQPHVIGGRKQNCEKSSWLLTNETIEVIEEVGCASHSDFQSKRDTVLDDYCIIDLTYYVWAEAESDDVRLCQGKECNYCGRYNAKLQRAGSP